jgi:hypothetical protein
LITRRHKVDQRDSAFLADEACFENKRVAAIGPRDAGWLIQRRDAPAAMLGSAEQRGKTRIGIECRPAQPVDRSPVADKGGGKAIADQGIIFDGRLQK